LGEFGILVIDRDSHSDCPLADLLCDNWVAGLLQD